MVPKAYDDSRLTILFTYSKFACVGRGSSVVHAFLNANVRNVHKHHCSWRHGSLPRVTKIGVKRGSGAGGDQVWAGAKVTQQGGRQVGKGI